MVPCGKVNNNTDLNLESQSLSVELYIQWGLSVCLLSLGISSMQWLLKYNCVLWQYHTPFNQYNPLVMFVLMSFVWEYPTDR